MKIAGVQMDVSLANVDANVSTMIERMRETVAQETRLTIFPECAATGYCFESLDEARPYAEPIPGPITERMTAACRDLDMFTIFGLLESDGDAVYNTVALTGPTGVIGTYRKVHLPFLSVDRFTTYGDRDFAVHAVDGLNVGMNICYDAAFPEGARAMAIQGADLIALPTNWPPGAECFAEYAINTRAMENNIYYAAVNRVGTERGCAFIGRSRICDPHGETLAVGSETAEEILYATVDTEKARNKRVVRIPGEHAIDRLADRRPEMYGLLTQLHELERPGGRPAP